MTEQKFVEIEATIERVGVKTSLRTKTAPEEVEATLSTFVETLAKNVDKILSLQGKITPGEKISARISNPDVSTQAVSMVDEPLTNIANDIGTTIEQLKGARIFGFKPGIDKPQLLSSTKFTPETAALTILYGFEIGLGKHFITYDEANELFMSCHYKVGSLSARVIPNVKKQNKIDANRYEKSKELTLSPSGLDYVRKELKKMMGTG
ncbi:hypothetical protein HYX12_00980 [Candidatus Woesearchaeota archaeon]|nr:hypothetical protein [Candidatus Woesearchaeota archaeon]